VNPVHELLARYAWKRVVSSIMKVLSNGIAVIEGDTHISAWVQSENRLDHDQYSLPIILEHIKEGDWVVDGGAFIGDHTIAYLKSVGNTGRVFAFEPNPDALACLAHNCPDAKIHPYGLGDYSDTKKICKNVNAGASSIGDSGETEVKINCLDSYDLPRLDFLKLDVEGYELKALQGAEQTICEYRPKMWIEINRGALERHGASAKDIFAFLTDYDYDIEPYPESGGEQYDILCLPR